MLLCCAFTLSHTYTDRHICTHTHGYTLEGICYMMVFCVSPAYAMALSYRSHWLRLLFAILQLTLPFPISSLPCPSFVPPLGIHHLEFFVVLALHFAHFRYLPAAVAQLFMNVQFTCLRVHLSLCSTLYLSLSRSLSICLSVRLSCCHYELTHFVAAAVVAAAFTSFLCLNGFRNEMKISTG